MQRDHKFLIFLVFATLLVSYAQGQPTTFAGVMALALKGDYQAQRNLAYGYASWPYKGQTKNPILACGWYQLIVHSGSAKVNPGDIGNVSVYCDRLQASEKGAALVQARVLYREIYKNNPSF